MKRVGGTPDLVATMAVTGSGATSYPANRSSTYLTVGTAIGKATRQSKVRAVYQPGKSLLLFQTFIFAPAQTNLHQRAGYFSDKNGVFFSMDDAVLNVNRRTFITGSAVDTQVPQASWNLDKLNGTGPSGKTLDITKPQILIADFEWLGVGRVRIGFVIDGLPVYCHQFLNANAALTSVYMTNPNLPVRWEIEATGTVTGTPNLEAICASVNSEGGYDLTGVTVSNDLGNTPRTLAGGVTQEILAIRLQSAFTEFATAFIQQLSVLAASSSNFLWRLVMNPTETGAGTWTAVPSSVLEKNTTRTITGGTGIQIAAGYVATNQNSIAVDAKPILTLGTTLAGVTDIFSLQVVNLGVGNEDYDGSLTWREVY